MLRISEPQERKQDDENVAVRRPTQKAEVTALLRLPLMEDFI